MNGRSRPSRSGPGRSGPGRAPAPRRTPIERFRALYGGSPAHLLILLASFAVCGYAAERLLERNWFDVAKWVVGAALLHDLVLLPAYAAADWALHRALGARRSGPRNAVVDHIRVPAFLSLLLLLVYWPLISGARTHYAAATALDPNVFLGRWALITGVLFAASAVAFALRRWRAARRPRRGAEQAEQAG